MYFRNAEKISEYLNLPLVAELINGRTQSGKRDSDKWTVLPNVFCSELPEEGN